MIPDYLISFNSEKLHSEETDFLIIGSGVAGLRAAFELKKFKTIIALKNGIEETSSYNAQGGIAVALSSEDEKGEHIKDTLKTGCGISDKRAVEILVKEGEERVKELIKMNFEFDKENGKFHFTLEGGHSRPRVLHSKGDFTGKSLTTFLYKKISSYPNIKILHSLFLIDLLVKENRVYGGIFLDTEKKKIFIIKSKGVILATGGAGNIYQETTNPASITGDGIAIAYRAGAVLSDMEFVQFHPTTFYMAGAPRFLISESVRGEGGILRNSKGERFMFKYHKDGELAPRDIVARAIIDEMKKTSSNCVYLDLTHLKKTYIKKRFPHISKFCIAYGIDIKNDFIPVRPSAHYFIGGIKTDLWGQTNIKNLFACGETASTGVHGANRLASNSLLEGLVFGARCGKKIIEVCNGRKNKNIKFKYKFPQKADILIDKYDLKRSIRSLMWRNVGIEREEKQLKYAYEKLKNWEKYAFLKEFYDKDGFEALNMLIVAKLITYSALKRRESRGTHYRLDYPFSDDKNWKKHLFHTRTRSFGKFKGVKN